MFRITDAISNSCSQFCIGTTETIDGLFLITYIAGIKKTGKLLEDTNLHRIGILELVDKKVCIARDNVALHFLFIEKLQEHFFHVIEVNQVMLILILTVFFLPPTGQTED